MFYPLGEISRKPQWHPLPSSPIVRPRVNQEPIMGSWVNIVPQFDLTLPFPSPSPIPLALLEFSSMTYNPVFEKIRDPPLSGHRYLSINDCM